MILKANLKRFEIIFLMINEQYKQRHKITNDVVYATSKSSDQPAHMRSLIRDFASRLNNLGVFKLLNEHHLELLFKA